MKSVIFAISALVATHASALALPIASPLATRDFTAQSDDPEAVPVTVRDLAQDSNAKCGASTYNHDDLYKAVQWGILLQNDGVFRGKKSKEYPKGRFPHSYTATEFTFNNDCPSDDNRQEYPLVSNGPYNGGISNNKKWGNDRVVYYHEPGEVDEVEGHPVGYFCGAITHSGASSSADFVQCT